jgi:hypothetical protein
MTLKRPLRGGEKGADVRMVQRALNKWASPRVALPTSGVYDFRTSDHVMGFQAEQHIRPATGDFGQATLDALWPYFDAYGRMRYRTFRVPGELPSPFPLVEPRQGFTSLHPTLYQAYSIGRKMGMSDLGTHNPASTLPGGGKSDHAWWPALAFDLGIDPDTGFGHPQGRKFFEAMMERPEIAYVILGNRIWSAKRASEGIRLYTAGGHLNHVHVSGKAFPL